MDFSYGYGHGNDGKNLTQVKDNFTLLTAKDSEFLEELTAFIRRVLIQANELQTRAKSIVQGFLRPHC